MARVPNDTNLIEQKVEQLIEAKIAEKAATSYIVLSVKIEFPVPMSVRQAVQATYRAKGWAKITFVNLSGKTRVYLYQD